MIQGPTIILDDCLIIEDRQPQATFCVVVGITIFSCNNNMSTSWSMYAVFLCLQKLESFSPQLPVLCMFQNVTYTIIISHEGVEVKTLTRQFSYSSGYNGECIEELVSDGLEEGKEYSVKVSVDAGKSGNSSSVVKTFSTFSSPNNTLCNKWYCLGMDKLCP